MKTRWFKCWFNGTMGYGANQTYYQNDDPNYKVLFSGYSRLDFPPKGEAWRNLEIGDTLKTISGSVWERFA